MKLKALIRSRAHRILKRLPNYRLASKENLDSLRCGDQLSLQNGEEIIGLYQNHPDDSIELIVVTTSGLHLCTSEGWTTVPFNNIRTVDSPTPDTKHIADVLPISLNSGDIIGIPIRGGRGKYRDLWQFVHFLDRVIEDIRKYQ